MNLVCALPGRFVAFGNLWAILLGDDISLASARVAIPSTERLSQAVTSISPITLDSWIPFGTCVNFVFSLKIYMADYRNPVGLRKRTAPDSHHDYLYCIYVWMVWFVRRFNKPTVIEYLASLTFVTLCYNVTVDLCDPGTRKSEH